MNTVIPLVLGLVLGALIGWLVRNAKRSSIDTPLEEELRRRVAVFGAEWERANGARLEAESARAAADATRQAALAQVQAGEEQVRIIATRHVQELAEAKEQLGITTSELKEMRSRC